MPSGGQLLAFVVASLVIILIPGPSVMFSVRRALAYGRRKALLTAFGNALGVFAAAAARDMLHAPRPRQVLGGEAAPSRRRCGYRPARSPRTPPRLAGNTIGAP